MSYQQSFPSPSRSPDSETTNESAADVRHETTPGSTDEESPVESGTVGDPLSCDLDFYWTVASGCSRKAIREAQYDKTVEDHGQTIDLSNYSVPSHAMVSFETVNNKPWIGPEWFIDSGGFSALSNSDHAKFETSIDEYIEYLAGHVDRGVNITKWALRDWPYVKEILRDYDRDIRDHQRWTTRDHVECLEAADANGLLHESGVDPVPVLQGRDVHDYLWHLDYLRDHGLLVSNSIGIGSLVSRQSVSETQSIIERVRDELPSKYTLHGFGIKKRELNNPDSIEALDSVDTAAWNYGATKRAEAYDDVRNTWIENIHAYQSYRDRLEEVFDGQGGASGMTVTSLSGFVEDPEAAMAASSFPLMECVCGTMVDWNAILDGEDYRAVSGQMCRHCENTVMTLQMGREGLLCDPEPVPDNHHPLCPH